MEISTTSFTTPSSFGLEPEWPFRVSEHAATTCGCCRLLDWIKYFRLKIVRLKPHSCSQVLWPHGGFDPFELLHYWVHFPEAVHAPHLLMDLQRLRGFLHPSRPRTLLHRCLRGILHHLKVEQESWCVFFCHLLEDHNLTLQVVHVLPHLGQPAAWRSTYKRIWSSIRLPSTSGRGAENLVLVPTFLFLRSWRPVWKDPKRGTTQVYL